MAKRLYKDFYYFKYGAALNNANKKKRIKKKKFVYE